MNTSNSSDIRLVHTTVDSRESAESMARMLLDQDVAACVSVGGRMLSVYRWQGETVEDEEFALTVKTRKARVEAVFRLIQKHHPYDCPELLVTTVEHASDDYEQWVRDQTR